MNKLLAIGDSFTYGEELPDVNAAWPYVLGRKLGYQTVNCGVPGSANYRMLRCLIEHDLSQFALVVIAWSHFDRIEMSDEVGIYETWPGGERKRQVSEAPWRKTVINYISRHHDDDYLYRQYLIYIILAQSHLIACNKPYIMLDAFGNHLDSRRNNLQNLDLVQQINIDRFLGWPNESMMEWTKNCPTGDLWPIPTGPGGHFLDEGHQIVAEKIYKHLLTTA